MRRYRIAIVLLAAAGLAGCDLAGLGSDDEDTGDAPQGLGGTWQEQAAAIDGIKVFNEAEVEPSHVDGPIDYDLLPPVGGPHNDLWQNCTGVVYDEQIANEHAVHSLEHGAVWVTYHPSLPGDHVAALADRVTGVDKLLMSPFPGLDTPISLQAWGHQLTLDSADDARIDEFIRTLRDNAGPEAGVAPCGGPNSVTTPDLAGS